MQSSHSLSTPSSPAFPSIRVFSKESELPWCPFNTAFLGSQAGACSCPPAEGPAPDVRLGQSERPSLEQRKVHRGAEPEEQAALFGRPRLPSGLQGAVLGAGCGAGLWGVCLPSRGGGGGRSGQCPGPWAQPAARPLGWGSHSVRRVSPGGTGLCNPKDCAFVCWLLLPSLIGYCWNLRLGAKRRSGRLKTVSRKKWGNPEWFRT